MKITENKTNSIIDHIKANDLLIAKILKIRRILDSEGITPDKKKARAKLEAAIFHLQDDSNSILRS